MAIWLLAAVVGPIAAASLRLTWLIPIAILVLTAGLLRGGSTFLDRLMLALILLLGAVPVAGLVFTVWPWGLSPVVLGAIAIAVLGLVHVLGDRSLRLPRPAPTDGVILAGAIGITAYFARPLLTTDVVGRLGLVIVGEDNSRHFGAFDGISRVGGFLFWQSPAAMPDVFDKMLLYPQGWHFTAAMLDGFVRASTGAADISIAINHYAGFVVATYGLLSLAVLWAARWIAGPLLSGWRYLPVAALLTGLLTFGELPLMLIYGFVSEIFGLTLLTIMIAVVVRRPGSRREQVVVLTLATLAIGFAYQLLLPAAVLMVAGWLYLHRRHLRPMLPYALVPTLGIAVAAVPAGLGLLIGDHARHLGSSGAIHMSSRSDLVALAALVAAAMVTPAGRRLRPWRLFAMAMVATASIAVALKAYGVVTGTGAMYYFEKALTAVTVALLIGIGSVALLLPRPHRATPPRPARPGRATAGLPAGLGRFATPATAVLLAVAAGSALGLFRADSGYRPTSTKEVTSASRSWSSGAAAKASGVLAADVVTLAGRFPPEPDVITIVLGDDGPDSYFGTLYLSMYQRSIGIVGPMLLPILDEHPADIGEAARASGRQLRIIATTPQGRATANAVEAAYPEQVLTIIE